MSPPPVLICNCGEEIPLHPQEGQILCPSCERLIANGVMKGDTLLLNDPNEDQQIPVEKRDHIAGQVKASCIIIGEVCQEVRQLGASEEVRQAANKAQLSLRKLLRSVGYME